MSFWNAAEWVAVASVTVNLHIELSPALIAALAVVLGAWGRRSRKRKR